MCTDIHATMAVALAIVFSGSCHWILQAGTIVVVPAAVVVVPANVVVGHASYCCM